MALVQMRTPSGSYSDVDEELVGDYQADGWVLTTDLPEFQGTNVVKYNPDKTVTMSDGSSEEAYKAVNYYTEPSGPKGTVNTNSNESDGDSSLSIDYGYGTGLAVARGTFSFFPEALIDEFAKNWATTGVTATALAMTRQTQVWKDNFGYLTDPVSGALVMSELEAMSNKASYRNTLSEYGIAYSDSFNKQFEQMITNGVAPEEFDIRVATVYDSVIDDIPQVAELYANQYGIENVTNEIILAGLINPDIQDAILNNEISTLKIGAEAVAAGFNFNFDRTNRLRKAGFDRETAKGLYGGAETFLTQKQSINRGLDISDLEESAIGNTEAMSAVAKATNEALAESSFVAGSRKKGDKVTGLTIS